MAKCPADFDFFSPEVIESPFEFYAALRREAPVYQLPGTDIYMLSRWEDIRRVNRDTKTFSNHFQDLLKGPEYAQIMAAQIPHAELHILTGAGHATCWERAAEFNTVVLGFLAKQEAS